MVQPAGRTVLSCSTTFTEAEHIWSTVYTWEHVVAIDLFKSSKFLEWTSFVQALCTVQKSMGSSFSSPI
jgi:hypothetical protein